MKIHNQNFERELQFPKYIIEVYALFSYLIMILQIRNYIFLPEFGVCTREMFGDYEDIEVLEEHEGTK